MSKTISERLAALLAEVDASATGKGEVMARKKTLLEIAKTTFPQRGTHGRVDPAFEDVAIAWLKGEIGLFQCAAAAKRVGRSFNGGQSYNTIAIALRQAYRKGRISIE